MINTKLYTLGVSCILKIQAMEDQSVRLYVFVSDDHVELESESEAVTVTMESEAVKLEAVESKEDLVVQEEALLEDLLKLKGNFSSSFYDDWKRAKKAFWNAVILGNSDESLLNDLHAEERSAYELYIFNSTCFEEWITESKDKLAKLKEEANANGG